MVLLVFACRRRRRSFHDNRFGASHRHCRRSECHECIHCRSNFEIFYASNACMGTQLSNRFENRIADICTKHDHDSIELSNETINLPTDRKVDRCVWRSFRCLFNFNEIHIRKLSNFSIKSICTREIRDFCLRTTLNGWRWEGRKANIEKLTPFHRSVCKYFGQIVKGKHWIHRTYAHKTDANEFCISAEIFTSTSDDDNNFRRQKIFQISEFSIDASWMQLAKWFHSNWILIDKFSFVRALTESRWYFDDCGTQLCVHL